MIVGLGGFKNLNAAMTIVFAALLCCLSSVTAWSASQGFDVLVSGRESDDILKFDYVTGDLLGAFVPYQTQGLKEPHGMTFGPDGNLYVCGIQSNAVYRFDGRTGAFIGKFAQGAGMSRPVELVFGPDENLYVTSFETNNVLKFDGQTGQSLGIFASSSMLRGAHTLVFGPDGNLYVSGHFTQNVVRFNGTTGVYMDVFTPNPTAGLMGPTGITFGPDGDLYVGTQGTDRVLQFDGTTGAFKGDFVTHRSGGLVWCEGIKFGPDGNLYVCARQTNNILRYNGTTGAFMGALTAPAAGGLGYPGAILFTSTLNVQVTAHIEPPEPRTNDDLECVYTIDNRGNYPQLDTTFQWFRNGDLLEDMTVNGEFLTTTGPTLSHQYTAKNESFYCALTVTDGNSTLKAKSSFVLIRNSTPSEPVVEIRPAEPRPGQSLGINILTYSTDADGDDVEYRIDWYESEDNGQTWIHKIELSDHAFIDGIYLQDGDLWRVEVTPYEVPVGLAKAEDEVVEGRVGWDQVYVGENGRPVVVIDQPGPSGAAALPGVEIVWHAVDPDSDPVLVDLYYDEDGIKGDSILIDSGLPASGSLSWQPPLPKSQGTSLDMNGDGLVSSVDLFILAQSWQFPMAGTDYHIFARAWDTKKAFGETFADGTVTAPAALTGNESSLLGLLDSWHK